MNLIARFRPLAQNEYDSSFDYYEAAQPGLGVRFATEVRRVLEEACRHPRSYPIAQGDIRQAALHTFPYCIYYKVRGSYLIIIAVYHQSRDPSGWKGRP
jgi:plasmid stabilization system protein ParE